MSDYNDNLLPDPCLRLDFGFGEQWNSVELGDGTGYVKAAPMLSRLGALHVELDEMRDENAKLREISADMLKCIKKTKVSKAFCWKCPHHRDIDELRSACFLADDARKLGIEVH